MRGEKLRANLPLFWNNDGKDRPKGQICPLAKKEVFLSILYISLVPHRSTSWSSYQNIIMINVKLCTPAIPLWFPKKWLFGFFILEKQLASQNIFLVKSNFLLQHISFLFSINQHRYNHDHFWKISRNDPDYNNRFSIKYREYSLQVENRE